jgi:hypothetical protein
MAMAVVCGDAHALYDACVAVAPPSDPIDGVLGLDVPALIADDESDDEESTIARLSSNHSSRVFAADNVDFSCDAAAHAAALRARLEAIVGVLDAVQPRGSLMQGVRAEVWVSRRGSRCCWHDGAQSSLRGSEDV